MPAQSIFTYLEPLAPVEDGREDEPAGRPPRHGWLAALLRRLLRRD